MVEKSSEILLDILRQFNFNWLEFASRVGVPALIAIIILTQLQPKIDRGIQIADHVDAELQYLAVRGCAPIVLNQQSLPQPNH